MSLLPTIDREITVSMGEGSMRSRNFLKSFVPLLINDLLKTAGTNEK